MEQITQAGITYEVVKAMPHPQFPGRSLLVLRRPMGKVGYVCTSYEDGTYSDVVGNPFCAVRRERAA